jgi:dTDP-4-amino-4,6-dideoxygalactose transaminase
MRLNSSGPAEVIRLLVPTMPPIEAAIPYIRKSEEAKHFSNFGPCVQMLEERLSEMYSGAYVVSVSNCTVGLELVYTLKMIMGARAIELPALTFPATWLAANRSGLEIVPIDVDKDTWIAPGVAGFGLPSYGPVVDAAGAFGEQRVPIMKAGMVAVFSGHATKSVGGGESGWIVTWSEREAKALRQMSNFGIEGGVSVFTGTNAKLSEYGAAMTLASLDAYDREGWLRLFDWYAKYLPASVVAQKRPRGAYTLMPVKLPVPASHVMQHMDAAGVQTRRWYTPILTKHPLFQHRGNRAQRRANPVNLPVTEDLEQRLLGLPYHLHLSEQDVMTVCETLERAISEVEVLA